MLNIKAALARLTPMILAAGLIVATTPFALADRAAADQGAANKQLQSAGLKEKYNASDISAMLTEFSIQTTLAEDQSDGTATMLAQTDGGAKFIITLMECDAPATGIGCQSAVFVTGASNAGLAYADLNDFNTTSVVTRVVNVPEQNLLLFGRQMFFPGGVGAENIKLILAFFLMDMNEFFKAQASGAQNVSLLQTPAPQSPDAGGKLNNMTRSSLSAAFGMPVTYKYDHVMDAAISNSWNVKFSSD